ncbi:MAG: hypothetical protein M3461_13405 [Pseudomonadota bacterium]|nr:hypothetical protein [Pseudomonadota bacterium]
MRWTSARREDGISCPGALLGARLMGVTGEVQREGSSIIARKLEDRAALLGGLRTVSRDFC